MAVSVIFENRKVVRLLGANCGSRSLVCEVELAILEVCESVQRTILKSVLEQIFYKKIAISMSASK